MSIAKPTLFCFGIGYTGRYVFDACIAEGFDVRGTCRNPEKAAVLQHMGADVHLFDAEHPLRDPFHALKGVTHLLITIPPTLDGDMVLAHHADAIVACDSLQWVGYLSTTGVYGDHQGGWVDENSAVQPSNARLQRRIEAEEAWLNLWRISHVPVHIFRLAGIYGPGRSAADQVLHEEAQRIDKPGQVFSRIHVEDIARVLLASMKAPKPGRIYNVCDNEPAPSHEVVEYACELLKVEPPPLVPFEAAELSDMARSFYQSNRRVSNARIRNELGVPLKYPTYREGLQAIVAQLCA